MTRLQHVLDRLHAAVVARAGDTPGHEVGSVVERRNLNILSETDIDFTCGSGTLPPRPDRAGDRADQRPTAPPVPVVRVSAPPPEPPGPSWASCEADELVAGLELSVGAVRAFRVLHQLACAVARAKNYRVIPDAVTLHTPALVVAALAGYTPRHLRRLVPELVAAGLVAGGPHASRVGLRSLWDGTIWAVKVRPGEAVPEIRAEDWRHNWRPTFEADVYGKTGARSFMSALQAQEQNPEEQIRAVSRAAVIGLWADVPPVETSSGDMGLESVQDVREIVYRLGELPAVHKRRRAEMVGALAGALSTAMDDRHSRRWYAGLIWRAWRGFVEGRADLQVLAGALLRLDDERRDWAELRRPAALLAARLRAA